MSVTILGDNTLMRTLSDKDRYLLNNQGGVLTLSKPLNQERAITIAVSVIVSGRTKFYFNFTRKIPLCTNSILIYYDSSLEKKQCLLAESF